MIERGQHNKILSVPGQAEINWKGRRLQGCDRWHDYTKPRCGSSIADKPVKIVTCHTLSRPSFSSTDSKVVLSTMLWMYQVPPYSVDSCGWSPPEDMNNLIGKICENLQQHLCRRKQVKRGTRMGSKNSSTTKYVWAMAALGKCSHVNFVSYRVDDVRPPVSFH